LPKSRASPVVDFSSLKSVRRTPGALRSPVFTDHSVVYDVPIFLACFAWLFLLAGLSGQSAAGGTMGRG
jgi:hypothetical protein